MQHGEQSDDGVAPPVLLRAVEYVRMSTEHQQYSTENQAAKIREYAARRGIEIVRTYADAGKSGLRIDGRASLQQLIKDVESGTADFTIILVYDSAGGVASRTPTKVRITSTGVGVPAFRLLTVPSSLRMTAPRCPRSSKVSSGLWLASTAGNCPPRYSLASVD